MVPKETINDKQTCNQQHETNRDDVQALCRFIGDGFIAHDIAFTLDAIGGYFISPRNDQRGDEAYCQQQ
ncbi:MAG: hypothetical protein KC572_11585 [Gammaproteobacteria bacterium]|nr:hypothetical protein [Gammaproteobacteria bacterium]